MSNYARTAILVAALLQPSNAVCTAPTTCYGEDCDYWVVENDATCSYLEENGCDCGGCACGESCPSTCFGETCDDWTLAGHSCESLEVSFQCNCGDCACNPPVTGVTTAAPTGGVDPITTTTLERVVGATDEQLFTGTVPLDAPPTTTESAGCPPGHICGGGELATTTSVGETTTEAGPCATAFLEDLFCDDVNNVMQCGWDGGDCCGANVNMIYCQECECKDPTLSSFYNCGEAPLNSTDSCPQPTWRADGYCDDDNNVCSCNWDGGDCCGADNQFNYCTECKCLDIGYADAACHMGCAMQAWVGDDFCDDENNLCGCDWDGGDCCGPNKHSTYCTECACLDPDAQGEVDHENCVPGCSSLTFYADGFCDDENNVCGCDWDGGDCCGGAVSFLYCTECDCNDPNFVCPGDVTECEQSDWLGDQFCDDGNNNCFCNWDHGDCCGNANFYTYCTECECLDSAYLSQDCMGTCQHDSHQGDGFCDDYNNNCGCDWDSGDCCGDLSYSAQLYCTDCACLDPDYSA